MFQCSEQLLFSCVSSKVSIVACRMSHVTCHMSNAYVDRWDMLNNFCFHVYAQNLLSHFLTPTLSHSHSFSLSHSFNLSFNHSRHAEQVLFSSLCSKVAVIAENCNGFFWTSSSSSASAPREFANHRSGSQLKNIHSSETKTLGTSYSETTNLIGLNFGSKE